MYFHILSNAEEVVLLPFLAFFTLVSEVKENAPPSFTHEADDDEDENKKKIKRLKNIMWLSSAERKNFKKLIFEMSEDSLEQGSENLIDVSEQVLEGLIDDSLEIFFGASETTSEKILNNQEMRVLLIKDLLKKLNEALNEAVEEALEPSLEAKKIMLFELVHMINAEEKSSEVKVDIIEYIGELFGLDDAYITEATKFSKNMHALKKEGFSLFL